MVDIELVLIEVARQQGHELNGQERLIIRTKVATELPAKGGQLQRICTSEFQWKKLPKPFL